MSQGPLLNFRACRVHANYTTLISMKLRTLANSAMSEFIDCVSNLFRPASGTQQITYNISLLALLMYSLLIEAIMLVIGIVPAVEKTETISGGTLPDIL